LPVLKKLRHLILVKLIIMFLYNQKIEGSSWGNRTPFQDDVPVGGSLIL